LTHRHRFHCQNGCGGGFDLKSGQGGRQRQAQREQVEKIILTGRRGGSATQVAERSMRFVIFS
jgi:hypothetical protein